MLFKSGSGSHNAMLCNRRLHNEIGNHPKQTHNYICKAMSTALLALWAFTVLLMVSCSSERKSPEALSDSPVAKLTAAASNTFGFCVNRARW